MALSTLACTVDETGISAPEFAAVLTGLQDQVRGIYGSDIYIENDSADGQLLGVFAKAVDDSNQTTIATYNNFSPQTAIGVGLSQVVKVNGLRRHVASRSTVPVQVIGVAGVEIVGGLVGDGINNRWLLADTAIPVGGSIIVTATCQTDGAVMLDNGIELTILTPVPGWQSAMTTGAAIPGAPVETDAALRQRQSLSTAQPALLPFDAIIAAIANLPGVQRVRGYENDTGASDANGIPGHSISLVVKGGDAVQIATAIVAKKAPGTGTYGSTTEVITDAMGVPNTVRFYYETDVTLSLLIDIEALPGYLSTTGDALETAVASYIMAQRAGDALYLSRLYAPANLAGDIAVAATGYSQAQLDAMAATYDIKLLAQARSDMIVVGGPVTAGATALGLGNAASLRIGTLIYTILDNTARFTAVISGVAGNVVTFAPAVPGGRSIPDASLVYSGGNLLFGFHEAPVCATADIDLSVS